MMLGVLLKWRHILTPTLGWVILKCHKMSLTVLCIHVLPPLRFDEDFPLTQQPIIAGHRAAHPSKYAQDMILNPDRSARVSISHFRLSWRQHVCYILALIFSSRAKSAIYRRVYSPVPVWEDTVQSQFWFLNFRKWFTVQAQHTV